MSAANIALNRFGLGARGDESPPADPKAWLLGQLASYQPTPPALARAPTRGQVAGELADYLRDQRPALAQLRRTQAAAPAPGAIAGQGTADDPVKAARQFVRGQVRDNYAALVGARTNAAIESATPFAERLVHFWANHFAVSANKLTVIGMAGLLEFDAIRPNLMGKFGDMLNAVERHPAMLLYLDQAASIGPNSALAEFARRRAPERKIGLNENLAREIMELHTLGVRTGYTQADVTEFARAMTGWTVAGLSRGSLARAVGNAGLPGDFVFAQPLHEPGARTIIGKRYDQAGVAQAQAVLDDLAVHPATARHIATKLCRHFAGDTPPPAMVARLEAAYRRSDGDLPTVYRALIASPEAWGEPPAKFRTPWEWSIAALRAVGARQVPGRQAVGLHTQLGQPVWRPGSPAGYDDIAPAWAGPDAVLRRVEAAQTIASRAGGAIDARALATRLFPGGTSAATERTLANADSATQALALLLVSPEMMRR